MTVPYATGRRYLDADSHIMDPPVEWLARYAEPSVRDALPGLPKPREIATPVHDEFLAKSVAYADQRAADPAVRADAEANLMQRRVYSALGAWDPAERSRALDLLGFDAQLVFATAALSTMQQLEDVDLVYGIARAHNRGMAEFCAGDKRLIGVSYVPLNDVDRAIAELDSAIGSGAGAILIPTIPPTAGPSPSHPSLDPFWARLEQSGLPFVTHVGFDLRPTGGWNTVPPGFSYNDRPTARGLQPGSEGADGYGYVALSHPAQMLLAYLILDGVFERFPGLRGGCIEQSAAWVPSWLQTIDRTAKAMAKLHPHFGDLTMKPSEYVRRHLKFTPFPFEPVDWLIEQAGAELFMFSSDYPHVEGGTDPIASFERYLGTADEGTKERFYFGNMAELLGAALPV